MVKLSGNNPARRQGSGLAKSVLLPGIAERRLGLSRHTQLAEPVLGDSSGSQETTRQP